MATDHSPRPAGDRRSGPELREAAGQDGPRMCARSAEAVLPTSHVTAPSRGHHFTRNRNTPFLVRGKYGNFFPVPRKKKFKKNS